MSGRRVSFLAILCASVGVAATSCSQTAGGPGAPPTAELNATPPVVGVGESVRLDAGRSHCADGTTGCISQYEFLFADGSRIHEEDLHFDPLPDEVEAPQPIPTLTLEESEIQHIRRVLSDVQGNVAQAAERLGVPRSSLYQKLKRYGIGPSSES